jgi:hypothetical protein
MGAIKLPTEAEVAELISQAGDIARGLAHERDLLRDLVVLQHELLMCYRLRDPASDRLLNSILRLHQVLASRISEGA